MGRFCDQCGTELPEGVAFCHKCGNSVLDAEGKKESGRKKWVLTAVLAIVFIFVIAGAGVALYITSDGYQFNKNLQLAEEHLQAEEYEEALLYYDKVLEFDPSLCDVYLKTAEIYQMNRDIEKAEEQLMKGMDAVGEEQRALLSDRLTDIHLEKVSALLENRNYEQAVSALQEYWEKEGDADGRLLQKLVEIYRKKSDEFIEQGEYEQAVEVLTEGQAAVWNPENDELSAREKQIRENIALVKEEICGNDGAVKAEISYEYDNNGKLKRVEELLNSEEGVFDSTSNLIGGYVYEFEDGKVMVYEAGDDTPWKERWYSVEYWKEEEVKSVKKEIYDIDEKSKGFRYSMGLNKYVYEPNVKKIIASVWGSGEEIEFNRDGTLSKQTYLSDGTGHEYVYQYNEAGAPIEFICQSSDGTILEWNEYEYDEKGNLVEAMKYFDDKSLYKYYQYEYDEAGNPVKAIFYETTADGVYLWGANYKYDETGKQIQGYRIVFDIDEQNMVRYDSENRLVEKGEELLWEKSYDALGNLISHEVYDYDFVYGYDAGKYTYKYNYVGE